MGGPICVLHMEDPQNRFTPTLGVCVESAQLLDVIKLLRNHLSHAFLGVRLFDIVYHQHSASLPTFGRIVVLVPFEPGALRSLP